MPGVPERKAEIIPYSNFMNLNAPDQDNACEGRWKILLCVFMYVFKKQVIMASNVRRAWP